MAQLRPFTIQIAFYGSIMRPIADARVARHFETCPVGIRKKLFELRELIFDTAAATQGVGEIEETLKWGEPAYVTAQSKSGSTIRIDWKKAQPEQYAMYFHCQTNLIETFRTVFPNDFNYIGNRSIVFNETDTVPMDTLAFCIAAALTYHLKRTTAGAG